MDRILIDDKIVIGTEVVIKGPPLEALLFQGGRAGSLITMTDAERKDFRGRVLRLGGAEAAIFVFDRFPSPTESSLEVILLQALPEKERMELIIQKATELGVLGILPFQSEKSISLMEREAKQRKAHRWQQIAIKAVRQSRRARVPFIGECRPLQEVLEDLGNDWLKVLLWERGGKNLKTVLRRRPAQKIYALIGPEGGFREKEVNSAEARGFIPVKLGQRILRTETAAISLMAILQYELGDLG